jgi:hypothetical protein
MRFERASSQGPERPEASSRPLSEHPNAGTNRGSGRWERACGRSRRRADSVRNLEIGGGRGIRTPGTVSRSVVFKTTAIDHSAIPPRRTSGQNSHPHEVLVLGQIHELRRVIAVDRDRQSGVAIVSPDMSGGNSRLLERELGGRKQSSPGPTKESSCVFAHGAPSNRGEIVAPAGIRPSNTGSR